MYSPKTINRIASIVSSAGLELSGEQSPQEFTHWLAQHPDQQMAVATGISRLFAAPRWRADVEPSSDTHGLLSREQAESLGLVFMGKEGGALQVLTLDPGQANELPSSEFGPLALFVGTLAQWQEAVEKTQEAGGFKTASVSQRPAQVASSSAYKVGREEDVIKCVHDILVDAISQNASDIHVEPFRDVARVRFRVDGILAEQHAYAAYVFAHYSAVASRFKILADCDIAERRIAQDGAILFPMPDGREIDLRFNTVPTKHGERVVARVLAANPALSLDKLGFSPSVLESIEEAIASPQGMVLVTGPTGSGKTTTLYGMLQAINSPERNILTAEDPVEYYLEGAGQVQANEKVGLTFAEILRAFLRQDPDVILVGEIRDNETVQIAVKAALTGHLLLSTLHTNDAISTVNRLVNLGVPPHMLSAALSLILAQRLARTNCKHCLADDPNADTKGMSKIGLPEDATPKVGLGCDACNNTGYSGRVGIYECLVVTDELAQLIAAGGSQRELQEQAAKDGFMTMQQMGRDLIAQGRLSLAEFSRTVQLG